MITSLRSKYMTSGYHHGRLITSWRERAYRMNADFRLSRQKMSEICDNIKYQSSVYGSFVWGIHVRYNTQKYQPEECGYQTSSSRG